MSHFYATKLVVCDSDKIFETTAGFVKDCLQYNSTSSKPVKSVSEDFRHMTHAFNENLFVQYSRRKITKDHQITN